MVLSGKQRTAIAAIALSAAGFVGIIRHEGYEPVAKPPVAGDVCTNGFGTTEGVKCGDRVDPVRAVERAMRDVGKFESAIRQCVTVPLSQGEYDAAVSLSYNIGTKAFCGSTVVRRWNAGDYEGGCDAFLMWDKFQGKPLPGLTRRRQEERARCLAS